MLTGLAGGTLAGFMGVGGGIVMVPMLTGLLGVGQYAAHGTSLALILPIAVAGVIPYAIRGNVDWPLVATITAGSVIGVYVGARVMLRLPTWRLRQVFGLVMLVAAARLLIGD
jgi:uncharacterized membrane protein YfcA